MLGIYDNELCFTGRKIVIQMETESARMETNLSGKILVFKFLFLEFEDANLINFA